MARRTTIRYRKPGKRMVVRIRSTRRKTVTRVKYTQYRMTPRRAAVLRRAQLASAAKRKGTARPGRVGGARARHPRISPRTRRNIRRVGLGAGVVGAGVGAAALATSPRVHRGVHSVHLAQAQRRNNAAIRARHVTRARIDHDRVAGMRARARLAPGPPFNAHAARREARRTLAYGRRR